MTGEVSALSALGVTVFLVLYRPTVWGMRVGPALAAIIGIALMAMAGHVTRQNFMEAGAVLWRPMIAVASIMVIAAAAVHLGVVNRLAGIVARTGGDTARGLFWRIFFLGTLTAAILNNDSAIIVLTPLVIGLIRTLYPERPDLIVPFAFAVFLSAGVAPVVTANPINLIVADFAGLDFNQYARLMIPVAIGSAVVTYLVLERIFASRLAPELETGRAELPPAEPWSPMERHGLILVLGILCVYPIVTFFDGSVWVVALLGAIASAALCQFYGAVTPPQLVARGLSWQILIFLFGIYTLALGLRNAGAVDWLITLYEGAGAFTIGAISAIGSALINNHSMALTNMVAIDALPGGDHQFELLTALIGGDLGPRLLPIGSLAGLLWYATLDRMDVHVSIGQFAAIGTLVTIPSLTAALLILMVMT